MFSEIVQCKNPLSFKQDFSAKWASSCCIDQCLTSTTSPVSDKVTNPSLLLLFCISGYQNLHGRVRFPSSSAGSCSIVPSSTSSCFSDLDFLFRHQRIVLKTTSPITHRNIRKARTRPMYFTRDRLIMPSQAETAEVAAVAAVVVVVCSVVELAMFIKVVLTVDDSKFDSVVVSVVVSSTTVEPDSILLSMVR